MFYKLTHLKMNTNKSTTEPLNIQVQERFLDQEIFDVVNEIFYNDVTGVIMSFLGNDIREITVKINDDYTYTRKVRKNHYVSYHTYKPAKQEKVNKILSVFYQNRNDDFSKQTIHKKTNINYETVCKIVNECFDNGLLRFRFKYYKFTDPFDEFRVVTRKLKVGYLP